MTATTLSTIHTAATIISAAIGKRFRGRAALLAAATKGNELALALLDASEHDRHVAAVSGKLSSKLAKSLGYGDELEAITKLRNSRRHQGNPDKLAARKPGNVPERATLRAFRAVLDRAGFRTAKNGHSTTIKFVPRGQERAASNTSSVSSSAAGMSNAYCARAFFVTQSRHTFHVSPAIFDVPKSQRSATGILRLSATLTVRQSRGTSLRTS